MRVKWITVSDDEAWSIFSTAGGYWQTDPPPVPTILASLKLSVYLIKAGGLLQNPPCRHRMAKWWQSEGKIDLQLDRRSLLLPVVLRLCLWCLRENIRDVIQFFLHSRFLCSKNIYVIVDGKAGDVFSVLFKHWIIGAAYTEEYFRELMDIFLLSDQLLTG